MDFIGINILDIIDIVVVAVLLVNIYRLSKGTNAPMILMGILVIYVTWLVVRSLNMTLLSGILGQIVGVGTIALVVIFQPEIRRFLHVLGEGSNKRRANIVSKIFDQGENTINENIEYVHPIVKACGDMSHIKTGALIVVQQQSDLSIIVETGIVVDARIGSSLLKNIFFKNSPLHDGAVVINEGRIVAAKCVLPTAQREVPVTMGMRHRAAIGITEVTDAVAVVVSEESGGISIASRGEISGELTPAELKNRLLQLLNRNS